MGDLQMKSSMRTQFLIMMIGSSLLTMICMGVIFFKTLVDNTDERIKTYRETLLEECENRIKLETETAISVVDVIYKQSKAGLITEEEAKKRAADIIRDVRYDNGDGYFWIDTYDGVNIALLGRKDTEGRNRMEDVDKVGFKYMRALIETGQKPGGGYTDMIFPRPGQTEPLPKRNYTASFSPYRWVMGTGVYIDYIDHKVAEVQEQVDADFRSSLILSIVVMIGLEIILVLISFVLSKRMIQPIRDLTEAVDVLATGDFRISNNSIPIDSERGDEIGVMSQAVLNLRKNVHDMVKKVAESAEQVAAASEQLTASADQSSTAINQVAESIVKVAGAATEQFTEVENASRQSEQLKTNMNTFTDTLSASSSKIEETNKAAEMGGKSVSDAVDQMKIIETSVSEASTVIAQLGEESDKIGKIVDAIAAIADQTNLLALNAAIEAARAGEHGRGFAVVADEVRKLAEQSQTSAQEISNLIGSIQEKAQDAVHSMQDSVKQTQSGVDIVDSAGKTFKEIAVMVTDVEEGSERMEAIVAELVGSTEVITKSVDHINNKSREVAKESETVSAASEEQTATMHEIADASRSLSIQAQNMQEVIARFKI